MPLASEVKKHRLACLVFSIAFMGVVPCLASDSPTENNTVSCHVGLYLVSLSDVDLRAGTCVGDMWIWCRWKGDDYNPLESIEVIDGTIQERTGDYQKTLETGDQYACQRIRATIRQNWDVSGFPLDTQTIRISLEDSANEINKVVFVPDHTHSRVSPSVRVPGWTVGTLAVATQGHIYETNYGDTDLPTGATSEYSRVGFGLALHRPGMGLFFKLFTGLFITVGIALLSLAIRPTDLDPRFGLPVGAMFASIASQYVVSSVLPESTDFTLADKLHVLAISVIFLTLLESVVSLLLTYRGKVEISRRLDTVSLVVMTTCTALAVVFLVNLHV